MGARPAKRASVASNERFFRENAAAPSYLDTLGITRPPPRPGDEAWLDAVGEATKAHRLSRATALDAIAAKRERAAKLNNKSEREIKEAGKWHRARAKGQRRRIEAVKGCRKEKATVVVCDACGTVREHAGRCSITVLCVSCRGERAARKRGTFRVSRRIILARAREAGLLRHNRRGGRWSEKFLTLTGPQLAHVDAEERIRRVEAAWPYFLRSYNRWLVKHSGEQRKAQCSAWFRNGEWTEGDIHGTKNPHGRKADGKGHPHIHAWLFCPYLDREMLKDWWRRALVHAGYNSTEADYDNCDNSILPSAERAGSVGASHKMQCDASPSPRDELKNAFLVYIKPAGRDVEQELIKYLTKDIASDGAKLNPSLYATVVKMFDGRRTTQASRGFMGLAQFTPECDCGACASFSVRIVDLVKLAEQHAPSVRDARAPP
jgi:hypothetical protein